MLVLGIILMIAGVGLAGYGFYLNNDIASQVESFITGGSTNPGTMWIIIGVAAAVIGLILLIVANKNKK